MTHYRASEAICHWRHLTVIVTGASVNSVVASSAISTATRAMLREGCTQFTNLVIARSHGMCWFQNDVFFFPNVWTLAEPYAFIDVDNKVTTMAQVETGCAAVGVRVPTYDSLSFWCPSPPWCTNCASGFSFGDSSTHTYYAWMPYGTTWDLPEHATYMANVAIHEFGHTLDLYFDESGLGQPMPHPDNQSLYEHLDGRQWTLTDGDTNPDFLEAMFTGDVRDKATATPQGATAAVWALGPPRKNYPR